MNQSPSMISELAIHLLWLCLLGFCLTGLLPLVAAAKEGMPDLGQIDQTCLPTSTANLIVWFGLHGYPKLIVDGDSRDDGYIHTVHRIITATNANFDWGTRPEMIVLGIKKYIEEAGYGCEVEYRGIGRKPFSLDWLNENDNPNKGFILLLTYCAHDPRSDTYSNAWKAGHAVTLVNAMPDTLVVHDPAHEEDQSGSKILTPQVLTGGTWVSKTGEAPVAGLLLLSGSMLDAPPNSQVMLIGAVCITMHLEKDQVASSSSDLTAIPSATVGGNGASPVPIAPAPANESWMGWLLTWLLSK